MRRPLLALDRTWWRPVRGGYEQQDGRAKIRRILANGRPVRWELWVDDTYRGQWGLLSQAKDGAACIPPAELESATVAMATVQAMTKAEAT